MSVIDGVLYVDRARDKQTFLSTVTLDWGEITSSYNTADTVVRDTATK